MAKNPVGRGAAPAIPLSDRRAEAIARRTTPAPAAKKKAAAPARPAAGRVAPAPVAARAAAPVPSTRIRVRAYRMGYLGHERRRVGDVFVIERKVFNPSWMTAVDRATPIQRTTGKEELRRKHDEILSAKRAERVTESSEIEDTGGNPLDAD